MGRIWTATAKDNNTAYIDEHHKEVLKEYGDLLEELKRGLS